VSTFHATICSHAHYPNPNPNQVRQVSTFHATICSHAHPSASSMDWRTVICTAWLGLG